ncbi:O-antigen ligase domain-containing protein [Bacteroides sp. 224]|nr:O-antigen ligase domain-containing protein [Bacteroides sp. 224]
MIILGVIFGLLLIYKFALAGNTATSLLIAILPTTLVVFIFTVLFYRRIFYALFISHFIILLVSSFTDIMIGAITLLFNITALILLVLISVYRNTSWKKSWNGMLGLFSIWGLYCIAELGNPNTVQYAWNIAITYYYVYPTICAILVPITIRKYKSVEWLLILWSVFVLIAAFKGYWQKSHGFNARELAFLFESGGARTHIIWSGIRYFSFFTDAANFGVHMAMAAFAFGMSFFYIEKKWLKVYFSIVVVAAIYGMFISGTRTAIVVPLAGLLYFIFLSKNWKVFFTGLFAVFAIFFFFRFTTIGNSNEYIRKMRSGFTPKNDASFMVRVENREKMKVYMKEMPFGYGLGLGGKAGRHKPDKLMPIPPDSWLVNVWTDTGIVGLVLYLATHIILFAWCSWILMFKVMNKRLRNILAIWLCVNAGFFVAAYGNDVMQYPNMIILYTGFALCFAAPYIEKNDKRLLLEKEEDY